MARRSARAATIAATAAAATSVSGASLHASPVRISGYGHRRPPTAGSGDATIQALLRLPGFAWEEDLHWIFHRESRELSRVLGAEVQVQRDGWRPASDQQSVAARVADLIEACCDEWLEGEGPKGAWQDGELLSSFWDQAAVRLSDTTSYWRNRSLTPTQVFKVAMTYTTRFDPKGRGANDQEQQWGFQRLTWGDRKAVINVDILARPWNAARDFHEYLRDTENDYGPIKPPNGTKPEQARAFLTWDPANLPATSSANSFKNFQTPFPLDTPPATQGSDNDVEMDDARPLHQGHYPNTDTEMRDDAEIDKSNCHGLAQHVKRPTLYGPRDPGLMVPAERIDILVNSQTGGHHKLMVKFRNISLNVENEQLATNGGLGANP